MRVSQAQRHRSASFKPIAATDQAGLDIHRVSYSTNATESAAQRKQGEVSNKVWQALVYNLFQLITVQDLFLDVLSSASTKRDARSYLSRFGSTKPTTQHLKSKQFEKSKAGVNLGDLYIPSKTVGKRSWLVRRLPDTSLTAKSIEPLHVALVKIRVPQSADDTTLQGIGHTLSQLTRLGLSCVVVLDCDDGQKRTTLEERHIAVEQADRMVVAIDLYGGQGARRLDSVVGVSSVDGQLSRSVEVHGVVRITDRNLLLAPLRRGVIPIVAPIAFDTNTWTLAAVPANEVVLAMTREFAGIQVKPSLEEDHISVAEKIVSLQGQIALDRIIILDPLGGIPSVKVLGPHIFINLEQEYETIRDDLNRINSKSRNIKSASALQGEQKHVGMKDLLKQFKLTVHKLLKSSGTEATKPSKHHSQSPSSYIDQYQRDAHLRNLQLLRNTLAILPPSSSALLTTPQEAANSGRDRSQGIGVGTRSQRNPLIHNLLTDKPVFSPSLPSNLLSTNSATTFVKRGMPVSIIPNPFSHPWSPPTAFSPTIQLTDPRIDFTRLLHLIEDSFGRKLDVAHYLSRIQNRIAGIIIAGEYEGGAILTWETPPGNSSSIARSVPYLDKFAVLKRSQGAGGVADIVFKAMVGDCFPNGVCWRSRRDNPVNKWYFERAKGTWKITGTNWTMFWTTEGVERGDGQFLDYEGVCKAVEPSWADNKEVAD